MTKKDYEAIAGVIKSVYEYCIVTDDQIWQATAIANGLAEKFEAGNTRFDAKRFMEACGIKGSR